MKLSRIVKRRKYKKSKNKINLFADDAPLTTTSGLPPKLERKPSTDDAQSVKDIFESIKKTEQGQKS